MSTPEHMDLLSELELEAEERDVLAELEALAGEPVTPPPALRDRLMAAATPDSRLEGFTEAVARLFDQSLEGARALLRGLDDPANWVPGVPPARFYWIQGGPACAGALTGFVRMRPGETFPEHTHLGVETVMVLQGSYEDSVTGAIVRPGDEDVREAGTSHAFTVRPGPDLLYLAVVKRGIEVGGEQLTVPED